jgi:hypothetical protein
MYIQKKRQILSGIADKYSKNGSYDLKPVYILLSKILLNRGLYDAYQPIHDESQLRNA